MNYFDLLGPPRGVGLRRSPRYGQRRHLPVNVLHPSWEPAVDARFSGEAYDVGSVAAARDYMSFYPDEYDPSPGAMDRHESVYLPYEAVPSVPSDGSLLPLPSDPDPEDTAIKPRYIFLSDSTFERALQGLSRDPDETKYLDDVVCSRGLVEQVLHDRWLEKFIDALVREDPNNPLNGRAGW